jgi:hypothetical protein
LVNPLDFVLRGLQPVRELEGVLTNVQLKNHVALESVRRGQAEKHDIDILIGALNMAEALAINGKGSDWRQELREGQDALHALAQKGVERGYHFIATGMQLTAINQAMEIHDAQMEEATVIDIEKAEDLVNKIVASGKARPVVVKEKT